MDQLDLAVLREKALLGTLSIEDTKSFIEATRASFLAEAKSPKTSAKKASSAEKADVPKSFDVDFF